MGARSDPAALVASGLAAALASGAASTEDATARCAAALGERPSWPTGLVAQAVGAVGLGADIESYRGFLVGNETLHEAHRSAVAARDVGFRVVRWFLTQRSAGPAGPFATRPLPHSGELVRWLGLGLQDLAWYADYRGLLRHRDAPSPLHHYAYRWLPKPGGGARLVEAPKSTLKSVQRRILREILDAVPSHPAAHGFVAGRDARSFASLHCDSHTLVRVDLQDFFGAVTGARVSAIFRALGYGPAVADTLTGLCTTRTPRNVIRAGRLPPERADRLKARHLPQGAPTSPALANLALLPLDRRLAAAAAVSGARYARYADDLAFSGSADFGARAHRFARMVAVIASEEGFRLNHRKTRVMRRGGRQKLAGVVVNAHPNVARADFDTLKATLHNCVRQGPASQNHEGVPDFRAHLAGRVAWVAHVNPTRGARLKRLFDRIAW